MTSSTTTGRAAITMTAARPRAGHTDLHPDRIHHGWTRTGRRSIYHAVSTDGVWSYRRLDDGSWTLWEVAHLPTGRVHPGEPSLLAAREGTASGRILAALDDAQRRAALPRCTWTARYTAGSCSRPATTVGRCTDHQPCTWTVCDRVAPPGAARCTRHPEEYYP